MNRPGYWVIKGGQEIPIINLEDSHLKNILRFLRNQRIMLISRGRSQNWIADCKNKIIELGEEAHRRNLIPAGDITLERLLEYIAEWQVEFDNRHQHNQPAKLSVIEAKTDPVLFFDADTEKKSPKIIKHEIKQPVKITELEIDRRLDLEL
jgi:hypothetical protein